MKPRLFRTPRLGVAALALLAVAAAAPSRAPAQEAADSLRPAAPSVRAEEDARLFADAARVAWRYASRQYQAESGLVNSVGFYPYATMWDIGSGLATLYCGNRLGFLPDDEYDRRMRRALQTLRTTALFDGWVFNKSYSTRTGRMAGRDERDVEGNTRGYGYSALDLGRLLIWLKIIATNDPEYAEEVGQVVARIDFSRVVRNGYLWGETVTRAGQHRSYQEGRLPYEQYAARGFALWGHRAERAERLHENSIPVTVMDQPLLADRRGNDHLTSEPVVLLGLELGWNAEVGSLAYHLLRVQAERYRRTGQLTMVSEDAVPRAPYYFYYYTVNYHGRQFAVTSQGGTIQDSPRWLSAKAAYAWHALSPDAYTRLVVQGVSRAADPERGWDSGVYERGGEPTGAENVNTAAVILEAALYARTGKPLLYSEVP